MAFQITTLMENTALSDRLAAEHGLSLLIEGGGIRLLYDTGGSPRFMLNARTLQIDLAPLDVVVLSHGHYDHTGGTAALLTGREKPDALYLGTGFFEPRYSVKEDGLMEVGAALDENAAAAVGVPCRTVGAEPLSLAPGVWLMSGFTSTDEMEGINPRLLRQRKGMLDADRFEDEVAVVLETEKELALISGCAHVGILSMCRRLEEVFGRPVTTFVGGTHLVSADDARIRHTCDCLRARGMKRLGACHCSGERAGAYFQEHFPGYLPNHVGSQVTIE